MRVLSLCCVGLKRPFHFRFSCILTNETREKKEGCPCGQSSTGITSNRTQDSEYAKYKQGLISVKGHASLA